MSSSIPPSILSFLSLYPHPAFILSSEPLREAFINHKTTTGGGKGISHYFEIGSKEGIEGGEVGDGSYSRRNSSKGKERLSDDEDEDDKEKEIKSDIITKSNSGTIDINLQTSNKNVLSSKPTTSTSIFSTSTKPNPNLKTSSSIFKGLKVISPPASSPSNSANTLTSNLPSSTLATPTSTTSTLLPSLSTTTLPIIGVSNLFSPSFIPGGRSSSFGLTTSSSSISTNTSNLPPPSISNESTSTTTNEKILALAFSPSIRTTAFDPENLAGLQIGNTSTTNTNFTTSSNLQKNKFFINSKGDLKIIGPGNGGMMNSEFELAKEGGGEEEILKEREEEIKRPSHSSLLEGGDQISHHPSRTAENAVASMYEHRNKKEVDENDLDCTDDKIKKEQIAKLDLAVERMELENEGIEIKKKTKEELIDPVLTTTTTTSSSTLTNKTKGMEIGKLAKPLGDLLKPIWGNKKWKTLVQGKETFESELGILGLLNRNDAQLLVNLLTNVLNSTTTSNSKTEVPESNSIKVTLTFPFDSIHYQPLASRRSAAPSNLNLPFNSQPLNPNSSDSTATATATVTNSFEKPHTKTILDLVATLYEDTNYLIITTVVSYVEDILPLTKNPSSTDRTNQELSESTLSPLTSSSDSIPTLNTTKRPPLRIPFQTSLSSLSIQSNKSFISDTSTNQTLLPISPSVSSLTTPTTLNPNLSILSLPPPLSLPLSPTANNNLIQSNLNSNPTTAAALKPRVTDKIPIPIPQYSGIPHGIPGVTTLPTDDGSKFPKGFLMEKRSRKKSGSSHHKKRVVEKQLSGGSSGSGNSGIKEVLPGIGEADEGGKKVKIMSPMAIEGSSGGEGEGEWLGGGDESILKNTVESLENSEEEEEEEVSGEEEEEGETSEDIEELDRELERLRLKTKTGSTGPSRRTTPPILLPLDPNTIVPSPPINDHHFSSYSTSNVLTPSVSPTIRPVTESIFPPSTDPFLLGLMTTPMGRLIRAYPWETSPLGPILSWSPEIKVMVTLCLATPFRNSIWLGEENVLIYNDEYAIVAGSKHPELLGKSGSRGWGEIWDTIGPLAERVMKGETISYYDHLLPMNRFGFLEETYYIWSFIPFRGADGNVIGYSNPCFETTARVVAERRLSTIRDLVQNTSSARTVKDYCQKTLQSLASNPYDIPFALLYTCESVTPTTNRSTITTMKDSASLNIATYRLNLEGTIGVPDGHVTAPKEVFVNVDIFKTHSRDSDASSEISNSASNSTATTSTGSLGESFPFTETCASRKPIFMADIESRTRGYEKRGWGETSKNGLCIPISYEDDTTSTPRAILIIGLNPRRPWNEVFATFCHLLSRQIGTGLYSVQAAESDAQRANEMILLDRAKTNFFSNVSHELRTPLTLILGPLEDVLTEKPSTLTPNDRSRLTTVQRHGTRLLNMVNTLLDFSRLEGGRMQVVFRPTRLSAVTADLGSLFRSAIERGRIEYIVDCEEDPNDGAPIYLAAELWEKVIFNLLGNAFKYTMIGKITLRVRYTRTEAKIQIIDTGCGIAEQELGHIFERFHRVESTSRSREGTGIGLALTLELVKVLGGVLEVESEVGKGSVFSVRLPRGSAHLPASQVVLEPLEITPLPTRAHHNLAIIEDAASWRIHSETEVPRVEITPAPASTISSESTESSEETQLKATIDLLDLKGSVILLVDDNEDLRSYIAGILGKSYKVVQAADGQAALEYAIENPPNLVVTDVNMPILDGKQLLDKLRGNKSTALVPIIFLSSEASPERRITALQNGADDYIVKPFQSRELIARVNVHLQLGRMRIELERRVNDRTTALVESEIRYRGLADRYSTLSVLSPVGIFMVNVDGILSYANPRWYEISGHHPSKPLIEWRDSVLPQDLHIAEETWNEAVATGLPGEEVQHTEFRWKKGTYVQFEIRSVYEGGIKQGFVGAITDISRQKKIEALHIQTVDQRAADAEENRRQMELFIDMASHELRNPLSGVYQNAEVVGSSLERITEVFDDIRMGESVDEETLEDIRQELLENTEAIESIILCASHQGRIADDILNVSKLNMGLLSINPVPFNLASKMTEVLRMFEVECQQKQITLTLAQGPSLVELGAEWIIADPSRLVQILINFLTNSVKYTSDAEERKITIHLDAFKTAPPKGPKTMRVAEPATLDLPNGSVWLVVGVEDSGKGLNSEELKKLFARFAQANPKSDQYGGSGLGLYVSRALVELHQGFIEVESIRGSGSTFKFAIPAAITGPPAVGTPPAATLGTNPPPRSTKRLAGTMTSSAASNASASPPLSGDTPTLTPTNNNTLTSEVQNKQVGDDSLHVLVVEDNLINQKVMQRQLKMAKFIVTVANNGQEALDIIQAEQNENTSGSNSPPINIVLMDIEMPIMNGLTAIRELRLREKSGQVKRKYNVIAVTGNARQGQIDECMNSGFNDVAIKPYRMNELLVQIHKLTDV